MKPQQALERFGKFIKYVLGYRPDEFGLIPDSEGFVKIKDLLKAVNEEEGWKHIRRSQLDALLAASANPPIEIDATRIRATRRDRLAAPAITWQLPKLLYTCVRRRAHPYVHRNGISPTSHAQVVLSSSRTLARRIGCRSDADPVLLTVQVQKTLDLGLKYFKAGEKLYLTDRVPPGSFTGPPLPKEPAEEKKRRPEEKRPLPDQPGSFRLDPQSFRQTYRDKPAKKRRKEADWKKERKRARKIKGKW